MEMSRRKYRYAEGSDRDVVSLYFYSTFTPTQVFKESLEELENIRYADDTVLITDLIEALQLILDKVNEAGIRYKLNINEKKTECMIVS